MFDARWRVHELDGAPPAGPGDDAALVAVVIESDVPAPREVRVVPEVGGSVHPPRRRGMPARGWTDGRFEGVVPAEGLLAVGFAAGDPRDPPAEVVDRGRANGNDDDASPTDLLRALGSPAPPRDAVPDGADSTRRGDPSPDDPPEEPPAGAATPDHRAPATVTDWLDAVDARVGGAAAPDGRRPTALAADEAALRAVAARASALASACRRARPTRGGP